MAKIWVDVANADPGGPALKCQAPGGVCGGTVIGLVWVGQTLWCGLDFARTYGERVRVWSEAWPDDQAGLIVIDEGLPADVNDGDWAGPWTSIADIPTGSIQRDTFYDVLFVVQSSDGTVRRAVCARFNSNDLRNGTARQLIASRLRAAYTRWTAKATGELLIYARRA